MRTNYNRNTYPKFDLWAYSHQERLELQTLMENKDCFMLEIIWFLDFACRLLPERKSLSKTESVVVDSLNDRIVC
jgi:hypothetical protein